MIERQTMDGRPCVVAYLRGNFEPAEKKDATFSKVIFDDGEVVFLSLGKKSAGTELTV